MGVETQGQGHKVVNIDVLKCLTQWINIPNMDAIIHTGQMLLARLLFFIYLFILHSKMYSEVYTYNYWHGNPHSTYSFSYRETKKKWSLWSGLTFLYLEFRKKYIRSKNCLLKSSSNQILKICKTSQFCGSYHSPSAHGLHWCTVCMTQECMVCNTF